MQRTIVRFEIAHYTDTTLLHLLSVYRGHAVRTILCTRNVPFHKTYTNVETRKFGSFDEKKIAAALRLEQDIVSPAELLFAGTKSD